MNKREIIKKTKLHVEKKLKNDSSGHDWWHAYRVWKLSKKLANEEGADTFIVELAALLHDISDWKFNKGDEMTGIREIKKWLKKIGVENETISKICDIVISISFKGALVENKIKTLEGKVVQDSDRLDAIGAIGIGRTFAYGGYAKRLMYDPRIKVKLHSTEKGYKSSKSPTINHFYEKLLLLKNKLNTNSAKHISLSRHKFMEEFLERFLKEWEGKK